MKRFSAISGAALVATLIILVLAAARQHTVTASARTVGSSPCPIVSYREAHPTNMTEVPSNIPCNGASINRGEVVLLPADVHLAGLLPQVQALAIARGMTRAHEVASLVLVSMTVPSSIPITQGEKMPGTNTPIVYQTIEDQLVWLATFHSPTPQNVSQLPGHVVMVSNEDIAFDARTGAFVYGFFTK